MAGQGHGLNYNVDIAMCIDCTGSMGDLLETVKSNALKFYPDLKVACDKKGKVISELRVRVIAFRDFSCDGSDAFMTTEFFNIPDQEDDFKSFVSSLVPSGGGREPENGLEALAEAINSDWTTGGDKRRHVIVVWSDASTNPLGEDICKSNPCYPGSMPSNLDELTDMWEDENGKMKKAAKRLIIFAPDAQSWSQIGIEWNNAIHCTTRAGAGLSDVEYDTIISTIVNSI